MTLADLEIPLLDIIMPPGVRAHTPSGIIISSSVKVVQQSHIFSFLASGQVYSSFRD